MSSTVGDNVLSHVPATKVWVENRMIYLELSDGRVIGFPSNRFKLLKSATDSELKEVKLELDGYALRWESLDEDLTVQGILEGRFNFPYKSNKQRNERIARPIASNVERPLNSFLNQTLSRFQGKNSIP
ncbi:PF10387 family protein [Leptospira santarosai]|nr:PF10387 family protein [Leptospira santarosai]